MIAHFLGFHVTQFLLFLSRFFPSFTPWVGKWAWWLAKEDSEVVDDGYKILNFDCLVGGSFYLSWNRLRLGYTVVPPVRSGMGDTRRKRESLPIGYAKMVGRRSGV